MIDQEGINSLNTCAEPITYQGTEGPKSPEQDQAMALGLPEGLTLDEAVRTFDLAVPEKANLKGMEKLQEVIQFFRTRTLSKGPIFPSPEDPVNPFGPKPIGPVLPDRQMAAFGGIMGLDNRKQYGIGSKFKRAINKVTRPFTKVAQKLMPKELAPYARMAAPFVGGPLGTLLYAAGTAKQKGKFNIGDIAAMAAPYAAKKFSYTPGQGIRSVSFDAANRANALTDPKSLTFNEFFRSKVPYGNKIADTLVGSPDGMEDQFGNIELTGKPSTGLIGSGGQMSQIGGDVGIMDSKLGQMAFGQKDNPATFINEAKKTNLLKLGSWGVGIVSGIQAGKYADEMAAAQAAEDALRAEDDAATQAEVDAARAWAIETFGSMNVYAEGMATGGRINKNMGGEFNMPPAGLSSLQTQASDVTPPGMELDLRGGGFIPIGKAEKADDVPARVSKNEFVFTADAVKAAGGGSVNEGAKKMYDTMKRLESQVA